MGGGGTVGLSGKAQRGDKPAARQSRRGQGRTQDSPIDREEEPGTNVKSGPGGRLVRTLS